MRWILALLLLTSCTPSLRRKAVVRPHYAYIEIQPNTYHVFAQTQKAFDEALEELCKVCAFELDGYVYVVTVPRK
jgi:hypothetical protein